MPSKFPIKPADLSGYSSEVPRETPPEDVVSVIATRHPLHGSVLTLHARFGVELTAERLTAAAASNAVVAKFVEFFGGVEALADWLLTATLGDIYTVSDAIFAE